VAVHGRYVKERAGQFSSELRAIQRSIDGVGKTIRNLGQRNSFEIEFLCQQQSQGKVAMLTNGNGAGEGSIDGVDVDMADNDGWIGFE